MATTKQPNTTAHGSNETCPHCHCDPASANLGQQLMHHITQLTPTERTQMLALSDRILAESNQQGQPKTTSQTKRSRKRQSRHPQPQPPSVFGACGWRGFYPLVLKSHISSFLGRWNS